MYLMPGNKRASAPEVNLIQGQLRLMATPLGLMHTVNDTSLRGVNSNAIKHYVLLTRLTSGH